VFPNPPVADFDTDRYFGSKKSLADMCRKAITAKGGDAERGELDISGEVFWL